MIDELVRDMAALQSKLRGPTLAYLESPAYHKDRRQLRTLYQQYSESVALVPLSRCPLCGEVVHYAIDLRGLACPWWWEKFPYQFPRTKACAHFLFLQGALDLNGHEPTEVQVWHSRPGPERPFVIERLMDRPELRAVVGEVTVGGRYRGFPIAYFSETPLTQEELHQSWARQRWTFYDDDGKPVTSRSRCDPWSFDVELWVWEGQVSWILPDDDTLTLRSDGEFPYVNEGAGERPQLISKGTVETYAAPAGQDVNDFRPHTGWR